MTESAQAQAQGQAQQQPDPYVARAQQQAQNGAFTSEVAALKMLDAFSFFSRAGLDRTEACSLAQHAITCEINVMRAHIDAKRVVAENEES